MDMSSACDVSLTLASWCTRADGRPGGRRTGTHLRQLCPLEVGSRRGRDADAGQPPRHACVRTQPESKSDRKRREAVWEELDHTVRRFPPRQLLASDEVVELVNIPLSATLPATRPLFEEGVIHTKSKTVDLGSHDRVRYVQMLREIGVVGSIEIPTSATKAGAIVDLFEKAAVDFREQATEHALKYVSGRESVHRWLTGCQALVRRVPQEYPC